MSNLNRNLTEGSIGKQLLSLTWPMLFGMIGMVIFNLTDTFFLGRLGVKPLAAISYTFPVIMFLNGIAQGIGIGTSSLVSRNIIATDKKQMKIMASSALLLGILMVVLFVVLGLVTIRPLFILLGAEGDILEYVHDYMSIWYMGVLFVVLPMVGNNIIRATGDTFTPGMTMLVSAVINTILDPLLIFGLGPFPAMGVKGAALATVIARSVSMVVVVTVLSKREKLITFRFGSFKAITEIWRKVLYIAAPATLGLLITPLSLAVITRIVSAVMIIFIGQNYSSHQYPRIQQALRYGRNFSLLWGGAFFLFLLLFAGTLAGIFTKDPQVIDIARKYFLIVGGSYGFQGLVMLSTSADRASRGHVGRIYCQHHCRHRCVHLPAKNSNSNFNVPYTAGKHQFYQRYGTVKQGFLIPFLHLPAVCPT